MTIPSRTSSEEHIAQFERDFGLGTAPTIDGIVGAILNRDDQIVRMHVNDTSEEMQGYAFTLVFKDIDRLSDPRPCGLDYREGDHVKILCREPEVSEITSPSQILNLTTRTLHTYHYIERTSGY